MNTPSHIAAVTLSLRNLIQAAMPPKVQVSTLPLEEAGKFVKTTGLFARVNVVCHQVSGNANARTISLTRDDPSADFRLRPLALSVYYLITVHGTPAPAEEQSTERLLEAVYHTIEAKPVLHSADLESALPGRPGEVHTATARIVQQALSFAEIESLFTALHAIYRPTLVYLVTLSEA